MDAPGETPRPDASESDEAVAHSSDERADHPASAHPTAGPRVGEEDLDKALDAMPAGNATTADMVDTDDVDSRAHDG